jgi:hypothetical protein
MLLITTAKLLAQDSTEAPKKKKGGSIAISNKGLEINKDTTGLAKKRISSGWRYCMLDLGFNTLQDNTNYADPNVRNYLRVPNPNSNTLALRNGKSINVNFYPVMYRFALLKSGGQRIYLSTGIGLQLYNFRYENTVLYKRSPASVITDSMDYKKDKLGIDYLNIPLMLTFKTKIAKDNWLVYGFGVTGGYRIASWNKLRSSELGKQKIHGDFGLSDFNECLTAEVGWEGIIRFYASYQLSSLYNTGSTGLDMHPVSFGVRIGGL